MIGVAGVARCRKLAESLVEAGLFEHVVGGYQVHDYLAMNQSRADVLAKRAADVERKRNAESGRNPSGVPPDSGRTPEVPARASHPIPSDPLPKEEKTKSAHVFPVNGTLDPEIGERAAWFLERYPDLYREHRHGARFLPKPALDWPTACDLVKNWPNDRLEKLAIVFLKTDHEFAANGSRTIRQFAALASWCDDRLRQVELERGRS